MDAVLGLEPLLESLNAWALRALPCLSRGTRELLAASAPHAGLCAARPILLTVQDAVTFSKGHDGEGRELPSHQNASRSDQLPCYPQEVTVAALLLKASCDRRQPASVCSARRP